jgi:hypothetical protein
MEMSESALGRDRVDKEPLRRLGVEHAHLTRRVASNFVLGVVERIIHSIASMRFPPIGYR